VLQDHPMRAIKGSKNTYASDGVNGLWNLLNQYVKSPARTPLNFCFFDLWRPTREEGTSTIGPRPCHSHPRNNVRYLEPNLAVLAKLKRAANLFVASAAFGNQSVQ
jgi:hypothetical protein